MRALFKQPKSVLIKDTDKVKILRKTNVTIDSNVQKQKNKKTKDQKYKNGEVDDDVENEFNTFNRKMA